MWKYLDIPFDMLSEPTLVRVTFGARLEDEGEVHIRSISFDNHLLEDMGDVTVDEVTGGQAKLQHTPTNMLHPPIRYFVTGKEANSSDPHQLIAEGDGLAYAGCYASSMLYPATKMSINMSPPKCLEACFRSEKQVSFDGYSALWSKEPITGFSPSEFTLDMWARYQPDHMKMPMDQEKALLFSYGTGFGNNESLAIYVTDSIEVVIGNESVSLPFSIPTSQWANLAFTWAENTATLNFYVDGMLMATVSIGAGTFLAPEGIVLIGREMHSAPGYTGLLDDIVVRSKALSELQIQQRRDEAEIDTDVILSLRFNGDYHDDSELFDHQGLSLVSERTFAHIGLSEGGKCMCGYKREVGSHVPDIQCNKPCIADGSYLCGSSNLTSIYTFGAVSVDNLNPNSDYEFQLTYMNQEGNLFTLPRKLAVVTPNPTRPGVPRKVHVESAHGGSITISWYVYVVLTESGINLVLGERHLIKEEQRSSSMTSFSMGLYLILSSLASHAYSVLRVSEVPQSTLSLLWPLMR